MATPNYGYEKRQRELAKKKKKEDKLRAKAASARQGASEGMGRQGGHDEDRQPIEGSAGTGEAG